VAKPVSASALVNRGQTCWLVLQTPFASRAVAVSSLLGAAYNEFQTEVQHAMGIRFSCLCGHKLHVKEYLAGKRGICPACGAKVLIPAASESSAAVAPAADNAGVQPPPARVATPSSASVVIPVVEPPNVTPTPVHGPSEVREAAPPLSPQAPPSVEAPTSLAIAPPSPAAKYEAQRNRARRQRTTLAIVLLVAVIVLAAVLVWVLQGGPAAVQSRTAPIGARCLAMNDLRTQTTDRHRT
jgi:hypothetical protein